MAKQRRPTARAAGGRTATKATRRAPSNKTAAPKASAPRTRRSTRGPVVKIRQAYAKAVALYEKGLRALQRKHYEQAAAAFAQVLEVPEERELHERARLYLNVCERESGPKPKSPRTVNDRILAATLALNQGDVAQALSLLRSAATSQPAQDHVQYMLALAHAIQGDAEAAGAHLKKAIALNPDNRVQARQERDFDTVRRTRPFLDAMKTP